MYLPKENYYHCFSPRVLEHLFDSGFEVYRNDEQNFNGSYLHFKTLKRCYVFLRTPELSECLAEVSQLR